jgi:hypothetical protein
MKSYKSSEGEVDLDDPETYKHLPNTIEELDHLMFRKIGYALCYYDYLNEKEHDNQFKYIDRKIYNFCKNRLNHYKDLRWYQEQVFIFEDEIENLL